MRTVINSDGEGGWDSAHIEDDVSGTEFQDQNKSIIEAQNTFGDISSYIDAKKVPDAFSRAFNKILEHEYDGITYRYKDLTFMELLSHGQNPFTVELTRLVSEHPNDTDDQVLQRMEDMSVQDKFELAATETMRQKNILKDALIDMRVGDEVLEVTPEIVNAMTHEVFEHLFKVITREGEAETEALKRFLEVHRSKGGSSDIPSS